MTASTQSHPSAAALRYAWLIGWLLAAMHPGFAWAEAYAWQRGEHTLALVRGTNLIWQIVADQAQGKPYFHPLATPEGVVLTDLRPADHPWHRGLWCSWKYMNGLNYWEEDHATGRSKGETELIRCDWQPHADYSARLTFELSYHPWNAPAVLRERREVEISAPHQTGYNLRWTAEFTAMTNVLLDRTPLPGEPHGQSWGGYAGLSFRLHPATKGWTFINSAGDHGAAKLHGQPAEWVKFSAGTNGPAVTIFDDPKNPRYPAPWYVNETMPFFSPSSLFHAPLALAAGEKLTLHYLVFITDHDAGGGAVQVRN